MVVGWWCQVVPMVLEIRMTLLHEGSGGMMAGHQKAHDIIVAAHVFYCSGVSGRATFKGGTF